jgi:hypothetical protein
MTDNIIKAIEIVQKFQKVVQMTTEQVDELVVSISDMLKDIDKSNYNDFEKLFDLWLKQKFK